MVSIALQPFKLQAHDLLGISELESKRGAQNCVSLLRSTSTNGGHNLNIPTDSSVRSLLSSAARIR